MKKAKKINFIISDEKLKKKYELLKNKSNFKNQLLNKIKNNSSLLKIKNKNIRTKNFFKFDSDIKIEEIINKLDKDNYENFNKKIDYKLNMYESYKNDKLKKRSNKINFFEKKLILVENINLKNIKKLNIKDIKLDKLKYTLSKNFLINNFSNTRNNKKEKNIKFDFSKKNHLKYNSQKHERKTYSNKFKVNSNKNLINWI